MGKSGGDSFLVKRVHVLRKIPLNDFTIEDLRLMIGQQIALSYLVLLAAEVLSKDLFAEGDFFEGDLLQSVLRINTEFWVNNKEHWITTYRLIDNNRNELIDKHIDTVLFEQVFI